MNVQAATTSSVYPSVAGAPEPSRPKADLGDGTNGWHFDVTLNNLSDVPATYEMNSQALSDIVTDGFFTERSSDWRGRGVGRALLYWQDGRARQMLVEIFGAESDVPVSISNLVDAHMTDRRRLYIAAGFFAKRIYRVMYRDLAGGEVAPQARHGYRIVPWNQVAQDQIRAIHMEAFQQAFRSPLRALWWDDAMNHFDPRWSFVAVDAEDEVVGYAMTGRPAARWVATGRPEAYIYLLGVAEAHRGRSVATALVGHAVAAASASGVSRIGLDVDMSSPDGAHNIYEHLGFVDEAAEVYYTIDQ